MAKDHIIKRLTRDVGQNKYSSKKIAQSSTKIGSKLLYVNIKNLILLTTQRD